jgi:hypothetical protein
MVGDDIGGAVRVQGVFPNTEGVAMQKGKILKK